jgi:hypothetical protein
VGLDAACSKPARQPETVPAGFKGDGNAFDPASCFLRLLPRRLRLRSLRQLRLPGRVPSVLSGATPLAYAKNRKCPAMERVMEQSFT